VPYQLLVLLSLLALAALVAVVRRHPGVGWLILAGFVISEADWTQPAALVQFGGLAIYPQDAAAAVFLLAVLTTPGAFRRLEPAEAAIWSVVLAMIVLSVLRGLGNFGLTTTGNEVRGIVALAACTLWVWSRIPNPGFRHELVGWSWLVGTGLMVDAFVHIAQRGLGGVDEQILVNGELVTNRPLVATQALILGLIGLSLLGWASRGSAKLIALGFVAMAVACQHRTVWAALAVAVSTLALFSPKIRTRLVGLGLFSGVVLLILYSAGNLDPLITRFDVAYHSRGTLVDRELAWRTLVGQQNDMGITTVLVGQPFGTGFARLEPNGSIVLYAPHNYYVSLYLRIGLLGTAAFVMALLRGLRRNFRLRQPIDLAWGAALMTFCYAYNLELYVAPILALSLGVRMAVPANGEDVPERAQPATAH
jgi:hypothetical protein